MKHYVMLNLFQHLVFSGFRSRNPLRREASKFGMTKREIFQRGQALITLLFFMIISITITSAAVVVILTNSLSAQKLEQGTTSYYVAESGVENAILRLLRDPSYTGETIIIDGATVVSTVANIGSDYTITSSATSGNFKRTVEVTASFVNNILTVSSWKEIFL